MSNIAVVVIALIIGLVLQRAKRFPENAASTLNLYVIYIALPALILAEISALSFTPEALIPVAAAWIVMLFSAVLTWVTARLMKWSRAVTGALMLLIPLGNTGFVGIPLIEAHLGTQAISYAILYDQLGTFIALNTYGIFIACFYSESSTSVVKVLRNILIFPPFVALIFALATSLFEYPGWLVAALARISSTLVPVVMVAVGLQWRLSLNRECLAPLIIGLLYILLISPAFAYFTLRLLDIDGLAAQVVVLEAAMPAMISAGVLAISHNLAPRFASSLVGYSLLMGLISVWLWRLVL
ncbi:MAG TPA: AEC family transporter [Cellvibrio sp.]|nr:AEC family transporter [Cellvibrio sp.]